MVFDWADYLTLAQELVQREEVSCLRSAISRAYYAAFGKAREHLEQEGVIFDADTTIHAAVWTAYRNSEAGTRHFIGIDGNSLRAVRNAADYNAEFPDLKRRAQRCVQKAEAIFKSLERLQP